MTTTTKSAIDVAAGPASPVRTRMRRPVAKGGAAQWPATCQDRDAVFDALTGPPFVLASPGSQKQRRRGVALLLEWLASYPGHSWQDRWLASGADMAGRHWREIPAGWLHGQGRPSAKATVKTLCAAVLVAICADVLRPGIDWFVRAVPRGGALARTMAQTRDLDGFTRLRSACDEDVLLPTGAAEHTRHRAAVLVGTKGGDIAAITIGDVVALLDAEIDAHRRPMDHAVAFYRTLHRMGVLGPDAPATLQQVRSVGQLSCEELIDRYQIACRPVRNLLVDYLRERQPALDYSSLRSLAATLGNVFWKDLESHNPGIESLRLPPDVAAGWKQRLRTRQARTPDSVGATHVATVDRVSYRQCLTPVRALYLDLAQWALEDPARWAHWVAPCPVGAEEINQRKAARQRKSRMDTRTRDRLPVLPVLVRTTAERQKKAYALLQAARQTPPGTSFTIDGQTLTRSIIARPTDKIWAQDPCTGKRRDLGREEDLAFWAWAAIETLRMTGVRIEELLELSHHSLVQYRLPSTGELIPLLQIAPSKTDAERLLVVSPELADVLSAIIRRVRGTGTVPVIPGYDRAECVWLAPAPWLFQRRLGTDHRRICSGAIRNMLNAALAETGLTDPTTGGPLYFTPHDFRRIFITDAIMSGLPPHIAQIIAGHRDINVTMGYKAVYPDEAIQAHRAFLARRRAIRPSEEYRTPTDEEWTEFLGHFERRKVAAGTCGRAFATPCIHEHACIRCPMLWPDPAQRARLAEIRDNLTDRITEAEHEGWIGEVEGLKISLTGANDKLAQLDRRQNGNSIVELGIPTSSR